MPESPTYRGRGGRGGGGGGEAAGAGAVAGARAGPGPGERVVTKEMIMKNVGNLPKWWSHPEFEKNE